MSTTTIKNYPVAPYYDDYDETKNYHRILYRPGYAVQARELTQMQTALQAQLDRFGQYAFKHGSRVVGGKVTINTQYDFIKIDSAFTHTVGGSLNSDSYLNQLIGTTITGSGNTTNQVVAKVLDVIPSDGTVNGPNTLYIKYISSGGPNNDVQTFSVAEEFASDGSTTYYGKVQSTGTPIGQGSTVNIEEGVYFLSGTFVYVAAGSLILDKYTNTPSYVVGLNVTESIVDTDVDATLKDNAQGTPNEAAPGATRYRITATLIKESLTNINSLNSNYVTLLRVDAGKLQVDQTDKVDSGAELSQRLARRTFEESGNYAVRPHQLDIKEHLNTGSNNGYLLAADGGDADKLAIGVEPGVSYVQGFRNEHIATKYLIIDKPRDVNTSINIDGSANVATPVGNYIKLLGSTVIGAPDLSTFGTISLHNATNQGGSVIGTARARALEDVGDTVSPSNNAAVFRLHLFDINMTSGTFSDVRSLSQTTSNNLTFKANISDSTALRYDIGNNRSVFKLPYTAISTLFNGVNSSTEYTIKKDFSGTVSAGAVTISLQGNQGHFTNINTATMISVSATGVIDTTPSFVGGTPSDGASSLTFAVSASDGTPVRILADVEVGGDEKVQKDKTRQNSQVASSVTASSDGSYSLGKADIIKIISVVDATGTNVTERFQLDNGQRDNFYGIGRIIPITGSSPVSGALTITFDYYLHSAGDYFSVDSYPVADYATIPTFDSNQGPLELRDCIDFRPRKADAADDFTSAGASLSGSPDPSHAVSMFIKYYLPRIDKLYITKEGELKTATGVPSDNPRPPAAPEDSMGLFDLKLKPYVFSTSDIIPRIIDNKRYTMRDIGRIDKRVKNLEYYTSLSLLEQQASNTQLFDGNNFSRTKNGFVVDSFRGHNVGNPSDPDHQCAVDKNAGTLRPKFSERNVNLIRKPGDTGAVIKKESLMMLPYTSTNYIDQPYASLSINVNPYNVFTWTGKIELSPESDEWKETDVRPDVIINDDGLYNQFVEMAEENDMLGTVWNEWETNWTGVEVDVQVEREGVGGGPGRRAQEWWVNEGMEGGMLPGVRGPGGIAAIGGFGREKITTTTATTVTQQQGRTGLTTSIASDTVTRESNNRVVEVNFVPFMRSRKIYFKAELLKPNTKMYPFFNDVNISAYSKQESFVQFADRDEVVTYEGATTHPAGTSDLVSNSNGICEGSFIIPRNQVLQFKTGTRTFKLTDSATNNTSDGSETTSSEAQFTASGLIESVQKEIISTKVPQLVTSELNEQRTLVETTVETTVEYTDPLAQTFVVDTEGGLFCDSLQLFFKTKDPLIGVRVSIRSVVNGQPTQRIVPGADKVIYPADVNLSEDASAATTVTFDHPIYLSQNQEYCIVLIAQSDKYEAWIAEIGGFDKTNPNNRITKQPYNGVFFTSANASTWTPEQGRDLKFKLNRCQFSGSGAELNLTHDMLPAHLQQLNPLVTTSGSGVIKVFHKNHGMQNTTSPTAWITGAQGFNGIAAANINGTRAITNVTHDTYEFTAGNSDTASATGSGGGSAVYITENRQMDVIRNFIQSLTVPGTRIKYYMQAYNESEIAQTEIEILANENIIFASPMSIASPSNTSAITKTYNLRCVFETDSDNLSPIIDMNRASLFTIQNRIIDNTVGDELSATGGNQLARYITKKVELAEEADKIDVFLNVNRPRSAAVDLYWRVIEGGSSEDIAAVNWQAATPVEAIAINDNPSAFKEVQFEIDPTGSFGTMQFKIVMRSTNSATVPQVKDFRAIAST